MTSQLTFLEADQVPVEASVELVAQERAALVTARLFTQGQVSLDEVKALTGLTYSGVWYLMSKIARVSPCWYDKDERTWKMMEE